MKTAFAAALLLLGCGARSALEIPAQGGAGGEPATTASVTTGPMCSSDAQCDDGVDCTVDSCDGSGNCVNTPQDSKCDDGDFCTVDTCNAISGCQNQTSDSICDDGIACTSDRCDEPTQACVHVACDGKCDDGDFCDGVERCDTQLGCIAGAPSCELGVKCSTDSCDNIQELCTHTGPAGSCFPPIHFLVTDASGALQEIDPWGNPAKLIAPASGVIHLDIAITNGRWFAVNTANFVELEPGTNKIKALYPAIAKANSLGGGPDGMLYAADTDVYRIDPNTGMYTDVGALPPGEKSSGDIAFVGDRMFISTDGPCGGSLVEFDLQTGTGTVLGGDGLGCVYGLAASGGLLYVMSCKGKIGTFDPDTRETHVLSTGEIKIDGAEILP